MRYFCERLNDGALCSADGRSGAFANGVAVICESDGFIEYAEAVVRTLWTRGIMAYISDVGTKCERVIAIGSVKGFDASEKTSKLLAAMPRKSEYKEASYIIYKDDKRVAIVANENKYTSYSPIGEAVEIFIKKLGTCQDFADLNDGTVASGTLDLVEKQRALDEIENQAKWEKVRKTIGDEDIYLSFRKMMESIFAKEAVPLLASFFDPATGLFYTSRSGKEAEGIYPIPEGTSQALGYIVSTGMLSKLHRRYVIPELARHRIVYYLKSIQGEDGEFYVSQMKMDKINSNRIGRDRGACMGLLWRLGASPTYSVGDMEGDGVSADEYWANLVKEGLVKDEEKPHIYWAEDPADRKAVKSEIEKKADVPTAAGTEQFQTHEGFIKWLLEKDPYNEPYSSMSATSSAHGLIADWNGKVGEYLGEDKTVRHLEKEFELKKGDTLYTLLIRWLDGNINEAGLFGKVTNDRDENGNPVYDGFYGGWGYQNSNGFLKGIHRYTEAGGIAYPKPREAAESLLKGIASDEVVVNNILVIYNVWSSLNKLRNNISSYCEGEKREELLELIDNGLTKKVKDERTGEMRAYAAIAIDKCLSKLLAFKKRDGGFGHSTVRGTGNWQGGLRVAISDDNLSDIDAINCSTSGLGGAMCHFFGLDLTHDIPMYTEADLLVYLDTLYSQPVVLKKGPMEI